MGRPDALDPDRRQQLHLPGRRCHVRRDLPVRHRGPGLHAPTLLPARLPGRLDPLTGTLMPSTPLHRDERGIALITVLLLTLVVLAIAVAATTMTANTRLIRRANDRIRQADLAALSGLEEARSRLNGTATLYPDSGYVTIDSGVAITDASGTVIPGATRWTYAGPAGVSTGQYGVFGAIFSRVTINGITALRRRDINQETFAKFAYFTNDEGGINFANSDLIQGPVHSNDQITIASSGATFTGKVTTAASSIAGVANGTFQVGYTVSAPVIT